MVNIDKQQLVQPSQASIEAAEKLKQAAEKLKQVNKQPAEKSEKEGITTAEKWQIAAIAACGVYFISQFIISLIKGYIVLW